MKKAFEIVSEKTLQNWEKNNEKILADNKIILL